MSQNNNIFSQAGVKTPGRSRFDLSHSNLMACNYGELVPVLSKITLPGSKWRMSMEWLSRMMAMVTPPMTKNRVFAHAFYVPLRVIWPNWEDFITETKTDGVLPAVPVLNFDYAPYPISPNGVTRLDNYLGVPFATTIPGADMSETTNAFYWAAYQKIWNDHYRDQNLQAEIDTELVDGDNSADRAKWCLLRKRAWMHDYFTSCLPETQKGDPVNIPMTFSDVRVKAFDPAFPGPGFYSPTMAGGVTLGIPIENSPDVPDNEMYADTSELSASASIIDLRTAEQLQVFRELMMTAGSRYNEYLEAVYGYRIKDETVQRSQYLGGMSTNMMISEVLNTSGNEPLNLPQGNMAGHGQSYGNGDMFEYTCPEHGVMMVIFSVMPESMYFQGIERELRKISDPFDFGNPLFAQIGEQEVHGKEIFAFKGDANTGFGYQQRYMEYKQCPNRVTGDFTDTLLNWHQARKFEVAPILDESFIVCDNDNDDLERIFAVPEAEQQNLLHHIRFDIQVDQPLPYFGTPTLAP